jgi:hypothetical protein
MPRCVLFILIFPLSLPVFAQPKLEPLPDVPPPPIIAPGAEAPLGQESITITPGPDDKVEEVVLNGQRAVKVTTPDGSVYYLMPDQRDAGIRPLGDTGLRVPMRVIRQF